MSHRVTIPTRGSPEWAWEHSQLLALQLHESQVDYEGMTVPSVTTGRGAWTAIGKDNKSRYYEYKAGLPLDGGRKDVNVNYQAVNFGVLALQKAINNLGYTPALVADGILGPKSTAAIKWAQTKIGTVADGQAGPNTMKAIIHPYVEYFEAVYAVPGEHVWGMTMLESAFDPGAVGYTTPSDRGLCQINLVAHPSITVEQAFDPGYALNYSSKRLKDARAQFAGKGAVLQENCSIAQHNSPLAAKQWYAAGVAPNPTIEKYVSLVKMHGASY